MHLIVSCRYVKETEENALFEINRLETENKSLVIHKPKVLGGKVKCKYLGFICCCDGAMINYQLGIVSERMSCKDPPNCLHWQIGPIDLGGL